MTTQAKATKPNPQAQLKKEEKSTALAVPAQGGDSVIPFTEDSLADYANSGLENVGAGDLLIPRLTIIQGLSPQLQKSKAEYIEGAAIGDICDVAARDLFKQGVLFLPVYYRKDYLEWFPRNSGKGLAKIHQDPAILDQCTPNDRNQPTLPNGNYVAETAQFFGLNLSAGRRKCYIAMASTQLKKARSWNLQAKSEKGKDAKGREFTVPLWGRSYMLTTAHETNNDGEWEGWVVQRAKGLFDVAKELGLDPMLLRDECLELIEALKTGEAKAVIDTDEGRAQGSSNEKAM